MSRADRAERVRVEEFGRRHRTALVTLVFTDLVDSVALRRSLGDQAATTLVQAHRQSVRDLLQKVGEAEEIETAGDSFLLVFARPSDAVKFALLLHAEIRRQAGVRKLVLANRVGIHVGEVVVQEHTQGPKSKDLYGSQIDLCARVMSLAQGGQILLTRAVFDSARQVLKGEELNGITELRWLSHGPYLLKGIEEPVEICEVGEGSGVLTPPLGSEKAQPQIRPGEEPMLGWRPAVGQIVPNTRRTLEKKLGEGGFGEVWLGRHQTMKERRVFKFCFRAERVRYLKRELTLFRLIKERIGDHPNIVGLREVCFEAPPYYIEMDYVPGQDLCIWSDERGGVAQVPVETRLDIVAQIADGLQAAHDAGVIHRDIKPSNILIGVRSSPPTISSDFPSHTGSETSSSSSPRASYESVQPKLTDFGIGQIVSEEFLAGVTRASFTQTLLSEGSSPGTGTQLYMAPELLAGKPASIRSDIYSLGVVLYQLWLGDLARPLTTDWTDAIADPLLRSDLAQCFAGNPQERFASVATLAKNIRSLPRRRAELEEAQHAQAAARRRRRLTLVSAALAGGCLLVTLALAYGLREAHREALEARRHLYVAHMNLVQQALQADNLGRANDLLLKHVPRRGQEDLRGFEWRYLRQFSRGNELRTLGEQTSQVTGVSFSTDGKSVASVSMDGTVKIWELESGRKTELAGSPEVKSGGWDNSVHYLADGKTLLNGSGRKVRWIDITNLKEWHCLPEAQDHVAVSKQGNRVATGAAKGVKIWDSITWSCVATLDQAGAMFALSPDGTLLAERRGEKVRLWDIRQEQEIKSLTVAPPELFEFVVFSPDGETLAAHGANSTIVLWNFRQDRDPIVLRGHKNFLVSAAFSPDGRTLATFSVDHCIKLWDVISGTNSTTLKGHQNEVWAGQFSPNGQLLVTGGKDFLVKLWDPRSAPSESSDMPHAAPLWLSPDSQTMLVCSTNGLLAHVRRQDLRPLSAWSVPSNHQLYSDGVSRDGRFVAIGAPGNLIQIVDAATGRLVSPIEGDHAGSLLGSYATFSSSGQLLVTLGTNSTVNLWEIPSGKLSTSVPDATYPFAVSPDDRILCVTARQLAAGDELGRASSFRVWDLAKGRELANSRDAHFNAMMQMVFFHDGRFLATASVDNYVKIWEMPSAKLITPLRGHKMGVFSVAIAPDGRTLASASDDGTVKLWNLATYQEVLTLPVGQPFHTAAWLKFSQDGNTLAYGTSANHDLVSSAGIFGRLWHAPLRQER